MGEGAWFAAEHARGAKHARKWVQISVYRSRMPWDAMDAHPEGLARSLAGLLGSLRCAEHRGRTRCRRLGLEATKDG